MPKPNVLVIEDDAAIRRGLVDALEFAGYGVSSAANGKEGLSSALEMSVDLVLLDVMMPKMNGFDVLHEIRAAHPTLPVIMVTARGSEDDRVQGLRDGADDYVVKPFSAAEVLARVEAVLRRSPERPTSVSRLTFEDRVVDFERREIKRGKETVETLTEREADILRYFAAHANRAIDRDELLHRVWGLNPKGIETRTVDMQIARLREKLSPSIIQTVRGKGYMLAECVQIES